MISNKKELIVNWLKDYATDTGFNGFVVGLSGGVDSTCSAALAVQAVGKENVFGVLMPCTLGSQKSRSQDIDDAILVAKFLGIDCKVVSLNAAAEEILSATDIQVGTNSLLVSNVKARLRAVTLRMYAEQKHYLVLGTTNRTEDLLGYFTKGGDGGSGVDVEPIATLFKYQVRDIVRSYGFDEKLANRVPTAGLFDDQTDEGELGVTYDQLDALFEFMELTNKNIYDFHLTEFTHSHFGFTYAQIKDIQKRMMSTDHKRKVPPSPTF